MKLRFLFFLLIFSIVHSPCQAQNPPFSGTIFLDPDIITPSDPTTFTTLGYTGQGMRTMFDRRVNDWITVNAYLFNANYDDGLSLEIQVNPEFGSVNAATTEANKYAPIIGQLPTVLRKDGQTAWIHKGVQPFGGGNNNFLIHTGQTAIYEQDGILEETLIHEGAHTSLDNPHATTSGWISAQNNDPTYISTYARDNPTREDIAESFLCWVMVRYSASRISQALYDVITQTIPNRLAYFDAQGFDMYPIVNNIGPSLCNNQTINISNNIANQTISDFDYITTSGNIFTAGNVTFQAYQEITLNSGFQINTGNTFIAKIIPCNIVQEESTNSYSKTTNFLPSKSCINISPYILNKNDDIEESYYKTKDHTTLLSITPNPLIRTAEIEFYLPNSTSASIELYDMYGVLINAQASNKPLKGWNNTTLNIKQLPSGVYHLVLRSMEKITTKKVMVIKN